MCETFRFCTFHSQAVKTYSGRFAPRLFFRSKKNYGAECAKIKRVTKGVPLSDGSLLDLLSPSDTLACVT